MAEREMVVVSKRPAPGNVVRHLLGGRAVQISPHVTFTPFASARPCSARCVFCSETLVPRLGATLGASLRPLPVYGVLLRRALAALRGVPIGISLSGLEATDDADWLDDTLDALSAHEEVSAVAEKVLYTNAAGLAAETTGGRLVPRLTRYRPTRLEVSRHHPDEASNQAIMRFRASQPIARGEVFERTLRALAATFPTRLVCIVQEGGVSDHAGARRYLSWAEAHGVTDVVFRELARLPSTYVRNRTLRTIETARVRVDVLCATANADPDFDPVEATEGYYYSNARFRFRGRTLVTFEASDYGRMKECHASDVIHKLVFFSNGNLCGDWDPDACVLARFTPDAALAEDDSRG